MTSSSLALSVSVPKPEPPAARASTAGMDPRPGPFGATGEPSVAPPVTAPDGAQPSWLPEMVDPAAVPLPVKSDTWPDTDQPGEELRVSLTVISGRFPPRTSGLADPVEGTVLPVTVTVKLPGGGTVELPGGGTLEPGGGTLEPGGGTLEPGGGTLEPGGGTVDVGGGTVTEIGTIWVPGSHVPAEQSSVEVKPCRRYDAVSVCPGAAENPASAPFAASADAAVSMTAPALTPASPANTAARRSLLAVRQLTFASRRRYRAI